MRVLVFNTSNGNAFFTEYGQLVISERLLTVSKFVGMNTASQIFANHEAGKRYIKERDGHVTLTITDTYIEVVSRDFYWRGQIKAAKLVKVEGAEPPF